MEKGSYVAENRFGHEEWLFNHECLVDGHRVGFIQAISKSRRKLAGQDIEILLYTKNPDGLWCKVGRIASAIVLTETEATEVVKKLSNANILQAMGADLERLKISGDKIRDALATNIVNIRFYPKDCEVLDPPEPFKEQKLFSKTYPRYLSYKVDSTDKFLELIKPPAARCSSTNQKKVDQRLRRSVPATTQDPKHDRLQNTIHTLLKTNFPDVDYEKNWIDLSVKIEDIQFIFEVKAASSVKRCIREALGQLLEYAHYPNHNEKLYLVVAGDAVALPDDRLYISFLRETYNLKLYYACYDWNDRKLNFYPLINHFADS
ncbi:hypothetical protein [Nitrosomonas sp. sh817]|uniref:hypothetical protein n=1 Tax=Nitrosomonas sp. sh817 TaxID=3070658 RepID=UPI0027DE3DFA|nr:hypothetical protein [Nitrosomonas sp. sh817]WMJ07982.1 hypothetical protein RBH92_11165 [Nitrosomonas sp. sh817]